MKCFILSQLYFMTCCLMLVFIVNFATCNSRSDDQIIIISTEVSDSIRSPNDSSASQTYNDALSLHFKLTLPYKFTGKFLKEAQLRIPFLPASGFKSLDEKSNSSSINKCDTNEEGSFLKVKLSRKSKCRNSVLNVNDLPVGSSRNCTDDNVCIDVSRIINYLGSCNDSLLENVYLDLTSCEKNDNIWQLIKIKRYLNLTLWFSEPSCDFDNGCEWNTITSEGSSYLTERKPGHHCCDIDGPLKRNRVSNCTSCKLFTRADKGSKFASGTYGVFVPGTRHLNNTFVSPVIYGSSYKCHLAFSVFSGDAEISLTINSKTVNRTVFVYTATSSRWERIEIPIGRITEHFHTEIKVILTKYNFLAIDNVKFEHCDETDEREDSKPKCKDEEFRCSTGLCVTRDKMCDLVPDCLFGDDEENEECDSIPVEGRCDFETAICNWTMETIPTDSDCNWKRKNIAELSTHGRPERTISNETEGYVLYIQNSECFQQIHPFRSRIFSAFQPGNCTIKFSYSFEQIGELILKMCYNTSNCVNLWKFTSLNVGHWNRTAVVIPDPQNDYFLQFDTTLALEYILLDNIAMTPDCFREKLIDPQVNHVGESDIEVMMTSIGASVGVFLGVVIALTSLLVYKRYRRKYIKDDPYRKVSAHSSSTSCSLIEEKLSFKDNASMEHFDSYDGSNRPPSLTYSDIATTISPYYEWAGNDSENIRNVPRKKIKLARLIGKGAFGEVYYGLLADVAHVKGELPVAIKTLPSLCSEQTKSEFFFEALILSKFKHPNIVKFLGISVDEKSMFLILELMEGGDVRSFLREARPREPEKPSSVCVNDLLRLASDIALGCQYLELNKFIHRDIAARNCLLTEKGPKRIAKIADFGMARDVYRTNYYRKNGIAMIPVKWMPPEAFMDGVFTVKTDVWAFGVVLWEIFTMGFVPYPGRSNAEVMKFVTDGGRLECPSLCPEEISALIPQCWASDPDDRPSFNSIVERLRNFNQNNHLYTSICLSDLKGKDLTKDENTVSGSLQDDSQDVPQPSSKTVTADVHIVAV